MDPEVSKSLLGLVEVLMSGILVPCFGYLLWKVYRLEKRTTTLEAQLFKERLRAIRHRRAQYRLRLVQERLKVAYGHLRNAAVGVVGVLRKGNVVSDYQLDSIEKIPSVEELLKTHE